MKLVLRCLVLLTAIIISKGISAQCNFPDFRNPSFEGTPQAHVAPPHWENCMPGVTPDIGPGVWGVTQAPSHGGSYVGFVHQASSDWREGAGQQLTSPLNAGVNYRFSLDLANVFTSDPLVGILPGCAELQIWGGFSACDTSELLWNSGNITPFDTWVTDTVVFTPLLNYTWILFRINSMGCSDGPYILVDNLRPMISVSPPPLNIVDSFFVTCLGNGITLGGTPVVNGRYSWTGGGLNSSDVNPVVFPTTTTVYNLLLTDTMTCAHVSGNTIVEVKVPLEQSICMVTADSASSHNIVIWEKSNHAAVDSFFIYRETSTNIYSQIGAVHRDSLSEFHDYGANPDITAYRYEISTSDTCQNQSGLSAYHNSIHMQYYGNGQMSWNVYGIESQSTPVSSFDVYCDPLGNGNWQLMVNVPGNQSTASDVAFAQHPNALYRVAANFSYTCTPSRSIASSLSNIISLVPTGVSSVSPQHSISIFPNPAQDVLLINTGGRPVENIRIYTADGKLMREIKSAANNEIDIRGLAKGVYISEVTAAGETHRLRWVKL